MQGFLIHYGEIGLKGKNRPFFEKKLVENVDQCLKRQGVTRFNLKRLYGRLFLESNLTAETELSKIEDVLRKVFGITGFSRAQSIEARLDNLPAIVWKGLPRNDFDTFRVRASRSDKSLPFNSHEIEYQVGGFIKEKSGARVDLENAELTCYIEALSKSFLVYFDKITGAGGLPVGTSGKVVVLLSGGIDSPVAAWQMMRRGAQCVLVHFHSYPHTDAASQEKVKEIARKLNEWQLASKLYLIPLLEIQKEIVAKCPEKLRVILYRRMMFRLAEKIAQREKCLALVTGESLGQVASQTLENINVVNRVVTLPVFRPLIGTDKQEITELAKRIGTYEVSIQPYQDCCSLFVPKHPETKASLEIVETAEKLLDIENLLQRAIAGTKTEPF